MPLRTPNGTNRLPATYRPRFDVGDRIRLTQRVNGTDGAHTPRTRTVKSINILDDREVVYVWVERFMERSVWSNAASVDAAGYREVW